MQFNLYNPSFTNFKTEIDSGRPALVGFASGNPHYNGGAHMTAGIGYYYDITFPQRYIYVRDAWHMGGVGYYVQWTTSNDYIGKIVP